MFLTFFFVFLCVIFIYFNKRGTQVSNTLKIIDPLPGFFLFNPCSCTLKNKSVDVFRYSTRNYCQNNVLPFNYIRYGYEELNKKQTSYIVVRIKDGLESTSTYLDTSIFGPGNYEDARIIAVNDEKAAIVLTRFAYWKPRICVALINISTDNKLTVLGGIEFKSDSFQKNWMPRMYKDSLLLYASLETNLIYTIPQIETLKGYKIISIDNQKIGRWRGSAPIHDCKHGTIGLVHYRIDPQIKKHYLPNYVNAFFSLDHQGNYTIYNEFTVELKNVPGFVYISGFLVLSDGQIEFCAGVTDCYGVKFVVSEELFLNSLFKKSYQKIEITPEALEIY